MSRQSSNTHRYISFLLRLWQEGEKQPWRASLEDPRSGERKSFRDAKELFCYLEQYMQENTTDDPEEV